MKVLVPIVNAFVDGGKGGNPAGVVLDADQYNQDEKQRIAAAIKLSETAFVSQSSIADFKLEFFTPVRQIAHCGHATIATFCYLWQMNQLPNEKTSKETVDGRREILMKNDSAFMEQLAPQYMELSQGDQLRALEALDINPSDLLEGTQPCIVDTGNAFLIIALRDSNIVKLMKPDHGLISKISEKYDLIGCYVFSLETEKKGRDAGARMFAPHYGIDEESATGMAAGPLACYLYDKVKIEKHELLIEQGYLMSPASSSVIAVDLKVKDGSISSLMAGGKAAVGETKYVEI
jgi:PhzF family phenazine biosynthesis protein